MFLLSSLFSPATFLRPAVINISRERRLVLTRPAARRGRGAGWLDCPSNVSACMAALPTNLPSSEMAGGFRKSHFGGNKAEEVG